MVRADLRACQDLYSSTALLEDHRLSHGSLAGMTASKGGGNGAPSSFGYTKATPFPHGKDTAVVSSHCVRSQDQ